MKSVPRFFLVLLFLPTSMMMAQAILLDKPVRAGELTLFPDIENDKVFYYLPDQPRVAAREDGKPEMSFLMYAENVRSTPAETRGREAEGGGIFHALVTFEVSQEQIRDAQSELQRLIPGGRIQGPIVYRSGKFGLVSSFKDPQGGLSRQVVGLGNAPVLEGAKAAISILLTKQGAQVLWESFHMATPDVSFMFEMEIAGYHSPSKATIEADWEKVYNHHAFEAAFATTFLGVDIKAAFDDLRQAGAIKVVQIGDDKDLERNYLTAYNKLVDVMFSPVISLDALSKAGSGGSLLDKATALVAQNQKAEAASRVAAAATAKPAVQPKPAQPATPPKATEPAKATPETAAKTTTPTAQPKSADTKPPAARPDTTRKSASSPSFALLATYEMRKIRQKGQFKLDLEKYTLDKQPMPFTGNIGDVKQYLNDPSVFREVNLDDPLFKQREIMLSIDGLNASDFGKFVNFVNVQLRKEHAEGATTQDEITIRRNDFNSKGNNFTLLYGWQGDNDRTHWLEYDLRRVWSFFGDQTVEQPWRQFTDGQVNLRPPYQRRTVELDADSSALAKNEVRSITVKIFYELAGAERMEQVTLNPAKNRLSESIEFMLPDGKYDYDYEIIWRLRGNQTVSSGRKTSSESILFVDEVPR